MRNWLNIGAAGLAVATTVGCGAGGSVDASSAGQLNAMVTLHEQDQPVFGVYAPRARSFGDDEGAEAAVKTPMERAQEAVAYTEGDYLFVGSMEDGVEEALPAFQEFVAALREAGATARDHPLVVKMQKISEDPEAVQHIGHQLNAGVSTIAFVHVETAEELRQGIQAMRFEGDGGTRSEDDVGMAPSYWGLTEEEYREQADVWPLDPDGELIAWAIVESEEGLANVREIAATPGLGVLFPGAGTLRRFYSTTGPDGERVVDEEAWENAIQTVLSACKEFDVPCGYPADAEDIEMRMEQGFSVFVMGWGESGFETVAIGRQAAGR